MRLCLLCTVGLTIGCAGAHPVAALAGDAIHAEQLAITDQTLTGFTAEARLQLSNSGEGSLQVTGATYQLDMDGAQVATGQVDLDLSADSGQDLSVRVPASAEIVHSAEELQSFLAHGATPIPISMHGSLKITQGGKTSEQPFSRTGELRAPRLPVVKLNDADLGKSDDDVTVSFYLGIENQNAFEMRIKTITYRAELDGSEVGTGVATTGDRLPPSQTAEYPIQENATSLDKTKTEVPYHLTGMVDLGLAQVPIDLSGTLTFSSKKAPERKAGKKHKKAP